MGTESTRLSLTYIHKLKYQMFRRGTALQDMNSEAFSKC